MEKFQNTLSKCVASWAKGVPHEIAANLWGQINRVLIALEKLDVTARDAWACCREQKLEGQSQGHTYATYAAIEKMDDVMRGASKYDPGTALYDAYGFPRGDRTAMTEELIS